MNSMTADPRIALVLAHQHQAEVRAAYPRADRRRITRGLRGRLWATPGRRGVPIVPTGEPVLRTSSPATSRAANAAA